MSQITILLICSIFMLLPRVAQFQKNQNIEIFNTFWETINTEYFDSTYKELNWHKEYDDYKPIIMSCKSDSLNEYMNQMLFKLNVSDLFALSLSYEDNEIGSPQLFLDQSNGIDIRIINDEAVFL